jgi:hypothetical protein
VEERVRHAEGNGERFLLRRVTGTAARRITSRRLYLDAMSEAISSTETILVDPAAGTPTLILGGALTKSSISDPSLLLGSRGLTDSGR